MQSFCIFVSSKFFKSIEYHEDNGYDKVSLKLASLPVYCQWTRTVHIVVLHSLQRAVRIAWIAQFLSLPPLGRTLQRLNNLQSAVHYIFNNIPCKIPPHQALRPRSHPAG
jgi:hypothetical protein